MAHDRPPSPEPEPLGRLRRRNLGYGGLLALVAPVILLQPLGFRHPWLIPTGSVLMALAMLWLTRHSPLQARRRQAEWLGLLAIVLELLWYASLGRLPWLAALLAIPHLLAWVLFVGVFVLRLVRVLTLAPTVTGGVVLAAACGYLMLGYLGAFVLRALLVLHPASFDPAALPAVSLGPGSPLYGFPAMVVASFGALTTIGPDVIRRSDVTGHLFTQSIAALGQLYVAVVIAVVLSRLRRHGS